MAELSCNGLVLSGQTSAATLAREVDRAGGLVVLDDLEQPGARSGKRSYSELSQLLKVGYKQNTSKKALTLMGRKGGQVETLDLFGLKVLTNTTGADDVLGSRMLVVPSARLGRDAGLERLDPQPSEVQTLRDDLHIFTMENVSSIQAAYEHHAAKVSTRLEEVAAPLWALADLVDGASVTRRLADALARQGEPDVSLNPTALVKKALENLVSQGFSETFCLFHLQLEVRRLSRGTSSRMSSVGGTLNAKVLGRILRRQGWVDQESDQPRPRLFGLQTRVYKLDKNFGVGLPLHQGESAQTRTPMDFCLSTACSACRYVETCEVSERKQHHVQATF